MLEKKGRKEEKKLEKCWRNLGGKVGEMMKYIDDQLGDKSFTSC